MPYLIVILMFHQSAYNLDQVPIMCAAFALQLQACRCRKHGWWPGGELLRDQAHCPSCAVPE